MMKNDSFEITIKRIHRLENNKFVRAFVDIALNDALLIKSLRVLNRKDGLSVAMPQEQAKDKKWYDRVQCLNDEIKEQITQEVLSAYNADSSF